MRTCRITGEPLEECFTLGDIYVSDFLEEGSERDLGKCRLNMCLSPSGVFQLDETPDFDAMYSHYWYRSGVNQSMRRFLYEIARDVVDKYKIFGDNGKMTWVDIGSNDGTLLSHITTNMFDTHNTKEIRKIGFEPSNVGKESLDFLDVLHNTYFNAEDMGSEKADVITAIAMFYDLDDPVKFMNDIHSVLKDDGIFVVQQTYLPLLLKTMAFDQIGHEHLIIHSLQSMELLFKKTGFKIVDVDVNEVNGGSFRLVAMKESGDESMYGSATYRSVAQDMLEAMREREKSMKLKEVETFKSFYEEMKKLRVQVVSFIKNEVKKGKTVYGYGASTKGNTLLQWFGLNNKWIAGIADKQEQKHGLRTVKTKIPIVSEQELRKIVPNYLLILPWSFVSEFEKREKQLRDQGCKFIVPCPEFKVY